MCGEEKEEARVSIPTLSPLVPLSAMRCETNCGVVCVGWCVWGGVWWGVR